MPESEPPSMQFGMDIANPGFVGQLRQFSVPLLARASIFTIAVLTLVVGILLIWLGWHACAPDKCGEKWLEVGLQVLGTTFLPVVVLGYLVFAETGVKALVRKSSELLRKTIPDALHLKPSAEGFLVEGAAHEGYVIDKVLTETEVNGRRCIKLVARLRMNDNFLWDPARKLHFAQDLRMFCHAMIVEGWPLLRQS